MRRDGKTEQTDLQLKIVLHGTKPPLWRRIVLPCDASLGTLHDAIQIAFGWGGGHLHVFADEFGREYGDAGARDFFDLGIGRSADEEATALGDVLAEEGARLRYTYDFGDDWEHRITLEKTLPRPAGAERTVRCVGGRRADVPAEDIGGVWGLAEVLELLDHADGPEHDPYGELIADLRARGYDPAAFDKDEITEQLAQLQPDTVPAGKPSPSGPARRDGIERLTAKDVEQCTCGRCRVGDVVEFDFDGPDPDAPPMRPVTLAPREELIAAVRSVPVFDAALRLAAWCGEGRQVTAGRVLRPALARKAIEELELWKLAPGDSLYADEASRARALKSLRSAGDVSILDDPWRLAMEAELVTLSGNSVRATAGMELGGEELLKFWSDTLGELLEEIGESAGSLDGLPGVMGAVLSESLDGSEVGELAAETADAIVGLLYDAPDDAWLDFDAVLGTARENFSDQPGFALVEVFFATSFRELGEGLALLGAVEYEPGDRGGNTPADLLLAVLNAVGGLQMNGRRAQSAASGEPGRGEGCADRMRLTPLGRYGLRAYLMDRGVPAPLAGEYADADAGTLIDGIMTYAPEVMRQEVDGWLERRTPADAAVQLLDACAGDDPRASARRAIAQLVLAELDADDPRALRVLRKAAGSEIEGCRQVAAVTWGGRAQGDDPPVDAGQAEAAALWLFIDGLSVLVGGLDGEELARAFRENRFMTPGALDQRVDDLWRVAHPATAQVLAELGEQLRPVDKKLAKRVRAAANKARSRR